MFYSRRVIDINDGKPKWTGLNDESELMSEGPSPQAPEANDEEFPEKKRKINGAEGPDPAQAAKARTNNTS